MTIRESSRAAVDHIQYGFSEINDRPHNSLKFLWNSLLYLQWNLRGGWVGSMGDAFRIRASIVDYGRMSIAISAFVDRTHLCWANCLLRFWVLSLGHPLGPGVAD